MRLLLCLTLFLAPACLQAQEDPLLKPPASPHRVTDSVVVLTAALGDTGAAVREQAAAALGRLGATATPAIPALIRALADADPYVNGAAADALALIGTAAVIPLSEVLTDGSPNVRWCAAIALGRMGLAARGAIPALIQALQDTLPDVRWCSTLALGDMAPYTGDAIPALVRCLADSDRHVRWGASLALEKIDTTILRTPRLLASTTAILDSLTPLLMNELHVPGVSIALISNLQIAWSRSYGITNADRPAPVTAATLFEACSMTKPVFACEVMKLVEQGTLDLDRPLTEYMEDFTPPAQPDRKTITARMVLSHTTGLPNWRKGEEERGGPVPVLFTPGSRFSYSGEGFFHLQKVVERITGEPLEHYAHRTLFVPLGLTQMSYVWTPALDERIAAGHDAEGKLLQKSRYTHANSAYTLYTSAEDYARVLVEIMRASRGEGSFLSRRSANEMLAPQIRVDVREPIDRPGGAMGREVFWGLGWSINKTIAGEIAHHSGANRSGFRCFSQFNAERGSGIVIMTNSLSGGELWTRLISRVGDL